MSEQYFSNHYAHINSIDPESESSIRAWLERSHEGNHRELGPHLPVLSGKRILEVGCGLGGTIHYLHTRGAEDVTGVDRSDEQLAVCRKFVSQNVVTADAVEYLGSCTDTYDIIIALDLIEHLPKHRIIPFLQAVLDRLREGGMVLLRTPNMGSLFGLRSRYIDFTHETGFTEESILQVMRDSGFRSVTVHDAYIGTLRTAMLRTLQGVVSWLYNIPLSRIITSNLIAIGRKQRNDLKASV